MATPLLHGFAPVVDHTARLLILGSFPSVLSLESGQYYGNPRNAFWPITAELFGFDAAAPGGPRFRYDVNPRFGDARGARSEYRQAARRADRGQ